MDPAELDRWTVFDIEPSHEDWIEYAKDRCNAVLVDFIRHNRAHLEHTKEFEPGKVYPSRRSWERLDRTLAAGRMLEGEFKPHLNTVYNIACGFVGFEAAVAFRDFADKYENQVTVEDILTGKAKTKGWKLNDHVAMVDKLLDSEKLVDSIDAAHLENLRKYFLALPSEAAMKFYTNLNGNKARLPFLLKLHKAEGVKTFITGLLAGAKKEK